MKNPFAVIRNVLNVTGAIEIALGVLFWTGHLLYLTKAAMVLGGVFVLALWAYSLLCARGGAPRGLVTAGLATGVVFAALAVGQGGFVSGVPMFTHWAVRGAHVVLALLGIGLGSELTIWSDTDRVQWKGGKQTPPVSTARQV